MHKGFFAERMIKKQARENSETEYFIGTFIDDLDFFQKEKARLIEEFRYATIDDDIRALHKEMLV